MALVKIISGAVNCGKTTTAEKLEKECRSRGLKTAGFLSVSDDKKDCYFFRDLSSGTEVLSVSAEKPAGEPGWSRYDFSRFYFSDSAFEFANSLIRKTAEAEPDDAPDVIFIDEMGPLELSGGGLINEIINLLNVFTGTVFLVIRENLVESLSDMLGIDPGTAVIIRTMPSN